MPAIICSFCFRCFGSCSKENFKKVWDHETKEHQEELQELEAQSHD